MKHVIPDLELKEIQNLSEITLNNTSNSIMQDKIKYRRKRVNQLRLRGFTNRQIAEKIGCDLSTIEKDLNAIRQTARQWFEHDSIIEYCQSINDGTILCDNIIEDLQILYSEEIELSNKLQILLLISQYETKKIDLFEKTHSVQCYLRGEYDELF